MLGTFGSGLQGGAIGCGGSATDFGWFGTLRVTGFQSDPDCDFSIRGRATSAVRSVTMSFGLTLKRDASWVWTRT
jgi:hypothetical protein